MHGEAGKGDRPRSFDRAKWDENWPRIFGDKKCKTAVNDGSLKPEQSEIAEETNPDRT